MLHIAFSAFGAILPSWVLLRYFYRRDVNPEPRHVLWRVFLLGVLIVIPVLVVATPLMLMAPAPEFPWLHGLYVAFLCAALPEEFFKFLVFTRYSARHPEFNEPMDGIVYGAVGSLGFATLENLLYVAAGGWVMAVARALTAVPMHAFLGAILGYYVGHSHLPPPVKHPGWLGLLAAVLLHGLYDFPLLTLQAVAKSGDPLDHPAQALALLALVGFALAILVAAGIWTLLLVRRARREQLELAALAAATQP